MWKLTPQGFQGLPEGVQTGSACYLHCSRSRWNYYCASCSRGKVRGCLQYPSSRNACSFSTKASSQTFEILARLPQELRMEACLEKTCVYVFKYVFTYLLIYIHLFNVFICCSFIHTNVLTTVIISILFSVGWQNQA